MAEVPRGVLEAYGANLQAARLRRRTWTSFVLSLLVTVVAGVTGLVGYVVATQAAGSGGGDGYYVFWGAALFGGVRTLRAGRVLLALHKLQAAPEQVLTKVRAS